MVDAKFLATIPIFSSLTSAELTQFANSWTLSTKRKNQIIFRRGDPGNSIYIVKSGSVEINIPALMGEEVTLTILNKGDVFGELTLFEGTPRSATSKALEKSELLEMPREAFITFLHSHPNVAIALLTTISKRLRETNQLMERQEARNVNIEMDKQSTLGERVSDRVSEFIGSWTFIFIFLVALIGWMGLNVYAILFKPVDPYPFLLLNFFLSCIAAVQAPVIMMSQGRQAKKDRIAADLDYKINLKAELQIQQLRIHIDELREQMLQNMVELKHLQAEMLEHLRTKN